MMPLTNELNIMINYSYGFYPSRRDPHIRNINEVICEVHMLFPSKRTKTITKLGQMTKL